MYIKERSGTIENSMSCCGDKANSFLSGSLSHLLIKVYLHVMQRAGPRD
jgi:hypothetical protein